MIRLRLTKDKFISIIKVIDAITDVICKDISVMPRTIKFARMKADLYVLEDLSRKMRSKFIMIEHHYGTHPITFSINEIQAFCIMQYKDSFVSDPYSIATMEEISIPIFKNLLE